VGADAHKFVCKASAVPLDYVFFTPIIIR